MNDQSLTYTRPGAAGMNTEDPSWRLKAGETPYAKNMILTRRVAAERNGWGRTGAADVFGAGSGGQIESVIPVQFDQTADTVTLVVTKAAGSAAGRTAPSSSATSDATLPRALARCVYQGQVILCPEDGTSSIRRAANSWTASQTATGTVAFTVGSPVVTGTGTDFLTSAPVGSFLYAGGSAPQPYGRVVSVQSNTVLTLDVASQVGTSGVSATFSPFGYVGLSTLVTDAGTASQSTTTLTGSGTGWLTAKPGYGAVRAGDAVAQKVGGATEYRILSVGSDTSATVLVGGTITSQQVNIYRALVGREATVHNNGLVVTGVQWEPRRVYYLPLGAPLGQLTNGEDSYDVNRGAARLAKWTDVPGPDTGGHIEALLSSPGPLLILGTEAAYGDFGTYPDDQVELLADGDGAGCIDKRSACSGRQGQAWCGSQGIYLYRGGGRVVDLTEGKRNREWRNLIDSLDRANAIICAGLYGDKLIVSVADGPSRTVKVQDYLPAESTSQTWSYDFSLGAWEGLHSGIRARYLATSQLPGTADELYMVSDETQAVTPVNQIATLASAFRDEVNGPTTNRDGLVLELPANAEGGSLTELGRMTRVRLALEVDQNADSALTISTTDDASAEKVVPLGAGQPTGAGKVFYQRVRPVTDATAVGAATGLGTSRRVDRLRISRTGVQPNALRIHEVAVISRPRPNRG